MAKTVTIQPTPNLVSKPVVTFKVEEYDAMVWNKGYEVIVENAVKCPCKTKNNDHLSTCQNCLGTGWIFINSSQDRALLSSINSDTIYKDWSAEKLGTVNVTLMRRSLLSYMDRITVIDSSVLQSEVLYPKIFGINYFSYTVYPILTVEEIFKFVGAESPLQKLTEGVDFTFDKNKIIFIYAVSTNIATLKEITTYTEGVQRLVTSVGVFTYNETSIAAPNDITVVKPNDITLPAAGRWLKEEDFVVSIRYNHQLQYHILDIPHVTRNSYRKNSLGRDELQKLPINGIARMAHYVLDSLNFAGDNTFDNSYKP